MEETMSRNNRNYDKPHPIEKTPIKSFVTVTCERLNLREFPCTESKILCVLEKGTRLELIGEANSVFFEVANSYGVKGYCMKDFVELSS